MIRAFKVFIFNDTATTEIYTYGHTLSLHDALPILAVQTELCAQVADRAAGTVDTALRCNPQVKALLRSEEHTSEPQSLMRSSYAVFCLKKKSCYLHGHGYYDKQITQ